MPTGDIRGNTATIKNTASSIREDTSAYGTATQVLFDTVDALKATWTSEDGNAYIAKINSYRQDFQRMQAQLKDSADKLEAAANDYISTIKANTIG